MQNKFEFTVLRAMFDEAKCALPPNPDRLAELLGVSRETVDGALRALDRAGLADAGRARLTMVGLAFAAAMRPAPRLARDVVLAA
jgi:Mn-dependent DtxR family transcriptional regulator